MRGGKIQQRRECNFFRGGRDDITEPNIHLHPNSGAFQSRFQGNARAGIRSFLTNRRSHHTLRQEGEAIGLNF